MSETADPFDAAFAFLGGRLRRDQITYESAWLQLTKSRSWLAKTLALVQRSHGRQSAGSWKNCPVGIEVDLLGWDDPNAFAITTSLEGEYAGISTALAVRLQESFWTLACVPQYLPDLGDNERWGSPEEIRDLILRGGQGGWGTLAPTQGVRRIWADASYLIAISFAMFHEVAHLTYGHCHDLMEPSQVLAEHTSTEASGLALASQIMEFDADEGAVAYTLDFVMETWPALGVGPFPALDRDARMMWWLGSILPMFRIFDLGARSAQSAVESSHPAPAVRTSHAIHCAVGHLEKYYSPEAAEQFHLMASALWHHIDQVWSLLGLPEGSHADPKEDISAAGAALRDELMRADKGWLNELFQQRTNRLIERYPDGPQQLLSD